MAAERFRIPPGYWRRFAAGGAFGIFMSQLLYYLNPQIEVSSTKLTVINLGYGAYAGLLFGTILWSLRLVRRRLLPPEEFKPHGFGIMTFAAWLSAFIFWGHYLTLRIYLPIQAVRILKRGTITIGVAAFLLFLLWLVERNAEKKLSQIIFGIGCTLLLFTGFLLHQYRESFLFPEHERMTVTVPARQSVAPIVVVVIDSVAHDWLIELEPERLLPFFHDRPDQFFSRLEPFPTTSPRSIWASLATGKLPYRHGITGQYGRTTPLNRDDPYLLLPNGVAFDVWGLLPPVRRESAPLPAGHAPAFWEIFGRVGRDARVLAWPGAQSVAVDPTRRSVARSPREKTLGPYADEVRASLDRDLGLLEETISLLSDSPTPDLVVVSLRGVGSLQETLGLNSNDLPSAPTPEGEAVRMVLEEIGAGLQEISNRIGDGVLVVLSPSAIHPHYAPDDLQTYIRSRLRPHEGDADGFLMMKGQIMRESRSHSTASLTDLTPTLLFAAGLAVGRDMDGRVITEAFDEPFVRGMQLQLLPSWDVRELEVRREPSAAIDH